MQVNVVKNAFEGSFWGLICRFFNLLCPFVIRTVIIHELGSEYTGLSSLFSSILNVFSLAELGIGSAMVYEMYRPVAENDDVKMSALLNFYRKAYLTIGIIILILGILVLPFLKVFIKGNIPTDINIYILFLIYLLNSCSSYFLFSFYSSVFVAYQKQVITYKIQLVVNFGMYMCQVVSLLLFKNYYAYIIFLPLATLIYNWIVMNVAKKKYPFIRPIGEINLEEKKSIKSNVIALSISKLGNIVPKTADTIIISSYLGLIMVSNYDNYYYILNAVTALLMVVFNVLTSGIGNRLITKSKNSNTKDFIYIFSGNALIVTVCTTCMFSMYQDFIELWVGSERALSFPLMSLFCLYFFVHMIKKPITLYRDAAGMWKDIMFMSCISSTVNLVLDIVLVRRYGYYGVIIPTIFCMLCIDMPWESVKLLKKILNYNPFVFFLRVLFYCLITITSCFLCMLLLKLIKNCSLYARLVIDFFVACLVSFVVFSLFTAPTSNNIFNIITSVKTKHRTKSE